jgi:hypothetical protein
MQKMRFLTFFFNVVLAEIPESEGKAILEEIMLEKFPKLKKI